MAKRNSQAARLLPQSSRGALQCFRNIFDGSFAFRMLPQFPLVLLGPLPTYNTLHVPISALSHSSLLYMAIAGRRHLSLGVSLFYAAPAALYWSGESKTKNGEIETDAVVTTDQVDGKPGEYLRRAIECARLSQTLPNARARETLAAMSKLWVKLAADIKRVGRQRRSQNVETNMLAGGCHLFTIYKHDPGFGCIERNRIFLLSAGGAGHTSAPARRVGSLHG